MRNDLVYSRRHDNSFMSIEEAAAKAPAAFTRGHADHLSNIYGEVDTTNVVSILQDYGFGITQAAQKKTRKSSELGYAEHLLAFAQPLVINDGDQDFFRPEIIVYNSRNGSSSLKIFTGTFRFICSNGMVAGEGMMQKIRHTHTRITGVEDAIRHAAESLPMVADRVRRFKQIELSHSDVIDMAYKAASLRWETVKDLNEIGQDAPGSYAFDQTVEQIGLMTIRQADRKMDLWTSFNRIQERMIRGGVDIMSVTEKQPFGKLRSAGPIRSVSESVRINRGLWDIAEEVAMAA